MNLDEETMISRLSDHPTIKMVYLEHLVEKSSKHDYVYAELASIYFTDQDFSKLRAFIRTHEKIINHTTIQKWLKSSKSTNVDKEVLLAETICRLGNTEQGKPGNFLWKVLI